MSLSQDAVLRRLGARRLAGGAQADPPRQSPGRRIGAGGRLSTLRHLGSVARPISA